MGGRDADSEGMSGTMGSIVDSGGGRRQVTFVRELDAPPEQVWDALTDPTRLARWLAPTKLEPGQGGRFRHEFGEGQTCEGTIRVWDPPRILEYGWTFTGERESVLRMELEPLAGRTRLTFHRALGEQYATGYGAGWHAYLDRLAALMDHDEDLDWDERFATVLPLYQEATR